MVNGVKKDASSRSYVMEGVLRIGGLVHAALHRILVPWVNATTTRHLAASGSLEELIVPGVDGVTRSVVHCDTTTTELQKRKKGGIEMQSRKID